MDEREVFFNAAKKFSALPADRVVILTSVNGLRISSIDQGILFLLALWSGPARIALHCLNSVLSRLPLGGDLKVYIVDVDGMTTEFIERELPGILLGGWGETFWIRDGRIQNMLLRYGLEQADVVEQYTRDLLTS